MAQVDYSALLKQAGEAADKAGDAWLASHTKPAYSVHGQDVVTGKKGPAIDYMLDVCGMAGVEIKDRRTVFAKWMQKTFQRYEWETVDSVCTKVEMKHRGRQEWGLREAMAKAVLDTLTAAGIKGLRYWSRID